MIKYKAEAIFFSRRNEAYLKTLSKIFDKFNVKFLYQGDLYSLASEVVQITPEFILVDGSTFNLSGFPFHLLNHMVFKERSKIIILSNSFTCENKFIDVVDINNIENYIQEYFEKRAEIKEHTIQKDRTNMINDFLITLGFSSKLTGKDYLKDCINLVINQKLLSLEFSKHYYAIVADKYRTKIFNVERVIRIAIQKAFSNRVENQWERIFNTVFNKAPSVKMFINMCVDKIIELKNL